MVSAVVPYFEELISRARPVKRPSTGEEEPHVVLGAAKNAVVDEIETAHRKLTFEYHPDRTETQGQKIRDVAAAEMVKINAARAELLRRRSREVSPTRK